MAAHLPKSFQEGKVLVLSGSEGEHLASSGREFHSIEAAPKRILSCFRAKHAYEGGRTEKRVTPKDLNNHGGSGSSYNSGDHFKAWVLMALNV